MGGARFDAPRLSVLRGKPTSIHVRLWNQYDRPLGGQQAAREPARVGWSKGQQEVNPSWRPGERKITAIPLNVPDDAPCANLSACINSK